MLFQVAILPSITPRFFLLRYELQKHFEGEHMTYKSAVKILVMAAALIAWLSSVAQADTLAEIPNCLIGFRIPITTLFPLRNVVL